MRGRSPAVRSCRDIVKNCSLSFPLRENACESGFKRIGLIKAERTHLRPSHGQSLRRNSHSVTREGLLGPKGPPCPYLWSIIHSVRGGGGVFHLHPEPLFNDSVVNGAPLSAQKVLPDGVPVPALPLGWTFTQLYRIVEAHLQVIRCRSEASTIPADACHCPLTISTTSDICANRVHGLGAGTAGTEVGKDKRKYRGRKHSCLCSWGFAIPRVQRDQ